MPADRSISLWTAPLADVVLIVAALATVALAWGNRNGSRIMTAPATQAPSNWRDETKTGIAWGADDGPLTIVGFMDLQCPYCARWSMRVDSLLELYPAAVQVIWHHYPLSSHELALPAAISLECASQQRGARTFKGAVFRNQKAIRVETVDGIRGRGEGA